MLTRLEILGYDQRLKGRSWSLGTQTYGTELEKQRHGIQEHVVQFGSGIYHGILKMGQLSWEGFRAILGEGRGWKALSCQTLL